VSVIGFGLFGLDRFFDFHVVKFFGVKDFATLQTLDKLHVVVPGDDTYSWMFADRCHFIFEGFRGSPVVACESMTYKRFGLYFECPKRSVFGSVTFGATVTGTKELKQRLIWESESPPWSDA
jgi:hypothetical protein